MALTYKGAIYGWGSNKYGQLGFSNKRSSTEVKTPILIKGEFNKVHQIVAGKYYSIAITKEETIYFWGSVILFVVSVV